MADYVLIDMAVVAFANAMRVQSIIGNTSLIIESEMFGQPTLRAKGKTEFGARPEDIRGLAAKDYVVRLSERLLPLAKQFHQMASEAIDSLQAATTGASRRGGARSAEENTVSSARAGQAVSHRARVRAASCGMPRATLSQMRKWIPA